MNTSRASLLLLILQPLAALAADRPEPKFTLDEVFIRARVTKMKPVMPVRIFWKWGGEGAGGDPVRGEWTVRKLKIPSREDVTPDTSLTDVDVRGVDMDLAEFEATKPRDKLVVEDHKMYEYEYLLPGTWSHWLPLSAFRAWKQRIFTVYLSSQGVAVAPGQSFLEIWEEFAERVGLELTAPILASTVRDVEMEFELRYKDQVVKRFRESGPNGATIGIAVPMREIVGTGLLPTDPKCMEWVCGLEEWTKKRGDAFAQDFSRYPWFKYPKPKKFAFAADCTGYAEGLGYGVRTTNPRVVANEFRIMRILGINGLRGAPAFAFEKVRDADGIFEHFGRARIGTAGFQTPRPIDGNRNGILEAAEVPEGEGCPFHPASIKQYRPRADAVAAKHLAYEGFHMSWALTDDEIGQVSGPEGKAHRYVCEHCAAEFRRWVRGNGATSPEAFGKKDWREVDPWYGDPDQRPPNWRQVLKRIQDAQAAREAELDGLAEKELDTKLTEGADLADDEMAVDVDEAFKDEAKRDASAGQAEGMPTLTAPEAARQRAQKRRHYYYSYRFMTYATAKSFDVLRRTFDEKNEAKRAALARGETDRKVARQPWLCSYAMRGQTFTGSHSLDFFEFYRYADNGFMYETSKGGIRNSYTCDAGRVIGREFNKKLALLVKPKRGSGMQSAMTLIARGGVMVYRYTYGPEYGKAVNNFGRLWSLCRRVSQFAHYIGRAEDVLWGGEWEFPPEVALVKPRTSKILGGTAGNSNGLYYGLTYAHVPVDPLDEYLLVNMDLSRYKVIYLAGWHLRQDAAEAVARWVKAGGALYVCGGDARFNEADEPLDVLHPVLGVSRRNDWQAWGRVRKSRSEYVEVPRPDGVELVPSGMFTGDFAPNGGRELIEPIDGAEVLARFRDGKPAVIRNRYGKGLAYLVAIRASGEYRGDPDSLSYIAAPALTHVTPPLSISEPAIEGILIRNPQTGKRAICLINWSYTKKAGPGTPNVKIRINRPRELAQPSVFSVALAQHVPLQRVNARPELTIPDVREVDILLFE